MFTLVEIFDAKQYENIITPTHINIEKLIYVGSKEIMTEERINNLRRFFKKIKFSVPVEFYYVERDNEQSIKNRLSQIVKTSRNVIFDATGGEDVILANVGVISERFSVPVIRIDVRTKKYTAVNFAPASIVFKETFLGVSDLITLEGGEIISCDDIYSFTNEDITTLRSVFEVNSLNPESYGALCNCISEFVSQDNKSIIIIKSNFEKNISRSKFNVIDVLSLMEDKKLIRKEHEDKNTVTYKIKSGIVAMCLKKAGNALEYYTAIAMSQISGLSDIKVGVQIEWEPDSSHFETQNEIDVMASSSSLPVFVSCKNGEVKKEALYELDSVARALGGSYAKKILVCTYLSKSFSARQRLLERAKDMGIDVVFNAHTKPFDRFLYYLENATS